MLGWRTRPANRWQPLRSHTHRLERGEGAAVGVYRTLRGVFGAADVLHKNVSRQGISDV